MFKLLLPYYARAATVESIPRKRYASPLRCRGNPNGHRETSTTLHCDSKDGSSTNAAPLMTLPEPSMIWGYGRHAPDQGYSPVPEFLKTSLT